MKQSNHLKAAVVGTGYFSYFQLDAWSRIPEVEVVAVVDLDLDKAKQVATQYNIPNWYSSAAELLAAHRLDFVDIVTPPPTHHALCEVFAQRGIDIICQKPLAPTYAESVALVEMVERYEVRFMVHENFRWQPWYREIKKLLNGDVLGEPFTFYFQMRQGDGWGEDAYLARQPFFRDYERLLIYETGVHFIDTFRYLFGEITAVYAHLRQLNPVIKGEDSGQVIFHHASGVTSIFDANRYNEADADDTRYTFGTARLDGSKGHLVMDFDGNLQIKKLGRPSEPHLYEKTRAGFAGDCVYAIQRHFVDQLKSGGPFENSGPDYLKTMRIVDAVYESNQKRMLIQVD